MPTRVKTTSAKTDKRRLPAKAPPKKEGQDRFNGFPDARASFFKELAKRQDRDWFAAHKDEFVSGYERPMRALLEEARAKIDAAYPDCDLAEPKVFRIHRDVRFSKDKSPYKTHIGGVLYVHLGGKAMTEAPSPLYVQIGTKSFAAAGHYMMGPPELAKYRASVLDEKKGAELAKLTAKLTKAGYEIGAFEQLKKVPRGVDPDHPRADLLKRKGLVVTFPAPKAIASRALLEDVVEHAKTVAPLVRWLTFNVAL